MKNGARASARFTDHHRKTLEMTVAFVLHVEAA
jgi:hypothetical protein